MLKSCVSFPTIPTFIANRHLADKLSCSHNTSTPAVMQLIILKRKIEVCKGRNTYPFLVLHVGCLLSPINSIDNSSPCPAVKSTPAWLQPQTHSPARQEEGDSVKRCQGICPLQKGLLTPTAGHRSLQEAHPAAQWALLTLLQER